MKAVWATGKLGEICDFEGGSQPPKSQFAYEAKPGYVRFLQIRDFGNDKNITFIPESKKNRLCVETDILIGRYGASVGKILTGKSGAYNVALMKTIPNLHVLDRSWFYDYLMSDQFQGRLLNVADRSAQNGFSKEDIYGFLVPVPPLPEQKRIVGILDEAFDGIATAKANAEKNLQNARALFESHLELVFTKRGEGSVEKTIDEVCDIRGGGTPSKAVERYWKGRIPWVSPKDMKSEIVSDSIDHISMEAIDGSATSLIPKGAVLMVVRSGILARIVPLAVTGRELTINQDLKALCPKNIIETRFLYSLLESKMPVLLSLVSRGATVHRLMTDQIRSLSFFLPLKAEQQRIIELVDSMREETRRLESIYRQKLAALEALKKSLLHEAFRGRL